ncbi:MAG: fibronectin type III domain-containing protein [Tepidisphaeraceae bacterium]
MLESLEQRLLFAFEALINFQPANAAVPAGYAVDGGAAYGNRGNGFAYGWDTNISADTRDRNSAASPDQRYDTLNHMQKAGNRAWEIAVPTGQYVVRVVSGDPDNINSVYKLNVEGQLAINATPRNERKWIESSAFVAVSDGRLTITNASGSSNNKINFVEVYSAADVARPSVAGISPGNGATGVRRDAFIGVDLNLPSGALNPTTVTTSTVKLFRASDNQLISANVNTSGGGDSIVLQPSSVLAANTAYYFEISSGVRDVGGNAFVPYSMTFTTGAAGGPVSGNIQFTKAAQATTAGANYTAIVIGPDRKVYAGTVDGRIVRFPINANGSLGAGQTINTIQSNNGGDRLLTGIIFDPASTADNLILWVTHGHIDFDNPPHWTGKISRLTGSNLQNYQDKVIGLPRAAHNHLTNQPVFGPDGFLYVSQGGNTAQGAKDSTWGLRDESLLSAAILRIDTDALPSGALNVRTEGLGASNYNPWASNAPVKLYASGLRNAYDLVWTSGGKLFAPNNGSNPGGATPATPSLPIPGSIRIDGDNDGSAANGHYSSPAVPGINPLNQGQNDYLYNVVQNGYYGHPNPSRHEYVLNGGNPTSGSDPQQVSSYPVGTQPDRNYRSPAFDFGAKLSPNGIIEYGGGAFGGALAGKLLVVRYSGGDDIIVLTPSANGSITASQTGMPGMTGFNDPLDLIEDPVTGNIYVAEFGGMQITLLTPVGGSTTVPATPGNVVASVVSPTQTRVTWSAVAGATLYRIQRKGPGQSSFSNYGTTASTAFNDTAASAQSTYSYRVRAENTAGSSAYSGEATVTTPALGQWSAGVPLPSPMAELGGAIINGKMYVAGENNTSTWEFDFSSQQWTARAARPFTGNSDAAEHATETVGGLLYLIGGLTGGSEDKVQIYNPATNTWSLGAQRSYDAGSSLSAVIGNEIYVTGGAVTVPSYQPVANTSRYNPATNTWTSRAPMPLPRHSAAGGTDGQKLYVFGGRSAGLEASDGTDTVQIYDPATNTWQTSEQSGSTIPRMPRPMRGASIKAIYYQGEFYVFGGENSSGNHGATDDDVFDRVDIYNPTTRTWRLGTPMPTARHATVAILHLGKVYVVGGGVVRGTSFSNVVEVLDLQPNGTPTPPAAPSILRATGASPSQVNLTWTDNSANETGFQIQRKTGTGGNYATIFTAGANATSYVDADASLLPGTQYIYRVRAVNGAGTSAFSNEDSGTTLGSPTAPAAPSVLRATGVSPSQVNLTWTDNSANETGFQIQRKTGPGGTYATIFTTVANATSYVDVNASLLPGTQYIYRVRAVNGVGPSAFSNEDSGTTLSAIQAAVGAVVAGS